MNSLFQAFLFVLFGSGIFYCAHKAFTHEVAGPKFKAGDCICENLNSDSEFLPPDLWCKKIIKVGKRNYLLNGRDNEYPFSWVDDGAYKVNCEEIGM
jgi:hypothetical protein